MFRSVFFLFMIVAIVPARAQEDGPIVPDDHIRQELGVNTYTAPSIEEVFNILDKMRPFDYDKLNRPLDDEVYPNRLQLSLNLGVLIAEGFLAVECEKREQIENVGRLLQKRANALGVGDSVTRRSKVMLTLAGTGEWSGLRSELNKTQSDVELALLELRDEEIAHMIALGGWLRGLEIAVKAVNEKFNAENAALLRDVDKVEYFIDRLDTLHPDVKKTPLIRDITAQLKTLQLIFTARPDQPLQPSDTAEIERIVSGLNSKIRQKDQ